MTSITLNYSVVSTRTDLEKAIKACKKQGFTALDFETTSLSPTDGRVRLVSLCNDKCHYLVDFDCIPGGFRMLAHLFGGADWVVFNAGFENRWFYDAGGRLDCLDVANLRRAILGGGVFGLKQVLMWDLKHDMSKEQQVSDWSAKTLTKEQLDYAYADAHWTWQLWLYWAQHADAGRWRGFRLFNNMVPAVIEMEDAGMLLDVKYHRKLVADWTAVRAQKIKDIRRLVPESEVSNIGSDSQWSDFFALRMPDAFLGAWPRTEKTGQLSMRIDTLKMLAGIAPGTPFEAFFDALSGYKRITKYLSSFGETLIAKSELSRDKRIRARFNICAARTGRFSCSGPNLQQIPRDADLLGKMTSVRRSFVAGLGRRLVSLDYTGIELRVLALLSKDDQLLEDMVTGDVHSEVAAVVAGRKIDKTTPEGKRARQAAKAVSFGIIYGAGAGGLSMTMRTTLGNAQSYIDFWQERYPRAFNFRYDVMDEVARTRVIRCVDGGTIYMGSDKPDLPKCSNYPVQRAALAILSRALVRHKSNLDAERFMGRQRWTKILATIHDAMIDEARAADATACLELMKQDMVEGYLDMFPGAPIDNLVEGGVGPNWAQLEGE